jgi:hypothetical protein
LAALLEFSIEDMVRTLLDNYEVDEDTAREDCAKIAECWREMNLIEE